MVNQAEQNKRDREQRTKRTSGAVKKAVQLGMLSDIDLAIMIHDHKTGIYHTFRSTDDDVWMQCINLIVCTPLSMISSSRANLA
jgi:hypothetical protein